MASLRIYSKYLFPIVIVLLFQFKESDAISGKVLHAMSFGVTVETAKMLPWYSSDDLGYGVTSHYQFDFTKKWSLISSLGYTYVGEHKDTPNLPDFPDVPSTTIKIYDIHFQLGMKRYFSVEPIQPYLSFSYSAHNLHKKYKFSQGTDTKVEDGLSFAFGYDIKFKERLFIVTEIILHGNNYYSYPALRLGFRYHIKDSY